MAIAQAMIEYIAKNIHCMTLFSTHYHELTFLEDKGLGIQNVHASARVDNDHLVFEYLIKNTDVAFFIVLLSKRRLKAFASLLFVIVA